MKTKLPIILILLAMLVGSYFVFFHTYKVESKASHIYKAEKVSTLVNLASDMRHFSNWNPWLLDDFKTKQQNNNRAGVGSSFSWESDVLGTSGKLEITRVGEDIIEGHYFPTSTSVDPLSTSFHFSQQTDSTYLGTWAITGDQRGLLKKQNIEKSLQPKLDEGVVMLNSFLKLVKRLKVIDDFKKSGGKMKVDDPRQYY